MYWVTQLDPVTHFDVSSSPVVEVNGTSCGGGGDGAATNATATPGQPGMNVQYVHWDHLGSTRLMTDEQGVKISALKYYPFGMEAESDGGDELRQKFTGHERDERVGLDYMMARSCRMALGRFLEPDRYDGSASTVNPQSWNRYAYVENRPINASDPSGYLLQLWVSPSPAMGPSTQSGSMSGPTYLVTGMTQPDNGGALSSGLLYSKIESRDDSRTPESARGEGLDVWITYSDCSVELRTGGSRSWRNNNPGNLRNTEFSERHGSIGQAGGFAVFPDESTGHGALDALLRTQTFQALSVDAAIARFAPPKENNTANYQNFVQGRTGLDGTTRLTSMASDAVRSIADAIKTLEGWREGIAERGGP